MRKNSNYDTEKIIAAFFIGAFATMFFAAFGLDFFAENLAIVATVSLIAILLLSIAFVIFILNKNKILGALFKKAGDGITDIHGSIETISKKVLLKDTGVKDEELKESFENLSSWYTWVTFRKWLVTVFYTLFLGFIGLLGTVLLYNQNTLITNQNKTIDFQSQLLESQNKRLDQQTYLMDSQMKKPLFSEVEEVESLLGELEVGDDTLSVDFLIEIRNRMYSFRPYRYLDERQDELNEFAYSPERSRIFIKILRLHLSEINWLRIKQIIEFNYVDISNTIFPDYTDFTTAELNNSKFYHCTIRNGIFNRTKLNATNFREAFFMDTSFRESFAPNCDFSESDHNGSDFSRAILNGA
ncbi:MAG: hypothetical protein AAFY76_00905, partial [Cyanobacteria bacterium J06649_11]